MPGKSYQIFLDDTGDGFGVARHILMLQIRSGYLMLSKCLSCRRWNTSTFSSISLVRHHVPQLYKGFDRTIALYSLSLGFSETWFRRIHKLYISCMFVMQLRFCGWHLQHHQARSLAALIFSTHCQMTGEMLTFRSHPPLCPHHICHTSSLSKSRWYHTQECWCRCIHSIQHNQWLNLVHGLWVCWVFEGVSSDIRNVLSVTYACVNNCSYQVWDSITTILHYFGSDVIQPTRSLILQTLDRTVDLRYGDWLTELMQLMQLGLRKGISCFKQELSTKVFLDFSALWASCANICPSPDSITIHWRMSVRKA